VVVKVKPVRSEYSGAAGGHQVRQVVRDWELVRISRLSVMPCPKEIWKKIEAMSEEA